MALKKTLSVVLLVVLTSVVFYFAINNEKTSSILFKQGSDKQLEQTDSTAVKSGAEDSTTSQEKTRLVYRADLSQIKEDDKQFAMAGVQDVIKKRIDAYGVSKSDIQIFEGDHLIIEIEEVWDVNQIIKIIEETTLLDFKEEMNDEEKALIKEQYKDSDITEQYMSMLYYRSTGLSGLQLSHADISFNPQTYEPEVQIQFNDEGTKLFSEITSRSIGRKVAIFLDGMPISMPIVQTPITDGKAVISGDFTLEEAKTLVQRINAGALPVSISLISQQTIDSGLEKNLP
ncbi:MAG: hypothetical protein WC178_02880 [Candidatus Paceibacterota bacterium]